MFLEFRLPIRRVHKSYPNKCSMLVVNESCENSEKYLYLTNAEWNVSGCETVTETEVSFLAG